MSSTLGGTKQLRRSNRQTSCRTEEGATVAKHRQKQEWEETKTARQTARTPLKHDIHSAGVPGGGGRERERERERERKDLRKHLER